MTIPDIKDAKRQLHDALTEARALPQWELVATAQILEQPDTMRLRVDGGHLYIHGNAMTFVPASEENGRLQGQLEQEQRGREQAEARCEELRRQVAESQRSYDRAVEKLAENLSEIDKLKKQKSELRRQVEDWEAEANKLRGAARTISVGPEGMRLGSLDDTSCTGRAPAEVGPSSFTMRGCRLTEGHAGPCEAWQQCEMGTADKRMRCRLVMGHTGECALGRA